MRELAKQRHVQAERQSGFVHLSVDLRGVERAAIEPMAQSSNQVLDGRRVTSVIKY